MNINSTLFDEGGVFKPVHMVTENTPPSNSKNEFSIEITNSKIVNFYNSHSNINIEEVNLHFINLMNI